MLPNLFEPLCSTGNQACGEFPMSLGWFNFTKPPRTTVPLAKRCRPMRANFSEKTQMSGGSTLPHRKPDLWGSFPCVWGCSNNCATQGTGMWGSFMSLGWFNPTEPAQATVLQREQGLLCYRGNMLEFTVVQRFRTHCTTEGIRLVGEFRMSSGWFNPTEPPPTTVPQREQGISHKFGMNLHFRTRSKQCTTQGTRPVGEFHKYSGWFNPTEPPRTTVLQREQGLYGKFARVPVGSMLPNLLEPLCNSKN